MFLVSLCHVNQARGFQNMGATGILRFSVFFFQKQISFKSVDTTPPHTYTSSRSCAYCCRRWIQLSIWYPNSDDLSFFILFAYILSFLIFVGRERELCGLVMLIASLQKHIPDFYGGLTPLAAEITKPFFVGAHIYPEEYHGYCHLQCCSSFYTQTKVSCIFSSPIFSSMACYFL